MTENQLQTIKQALYDAEILEVKKLEALPIIEVEHSTNYNKKINTLLEKARRGDFSPSNRTRKRRVMLLVAVIVVFALTVTACTFGEQIKNFCFSKYEKFMRVEVNGEPDNMSFKQYIPTFVPDGYVLEDNDVGNGYSRLIFINGSHRIYIDQDKLSSGKLILDTENAEYSEMDIGGKRVYCLKKNNTYTLLWLNNNYQFLVTCHSSIEWNNIESMINSLGD